MAKKKVYIGSVGPFVYDDANLINDPDGDFPGEFQRAITSDGSIKPGSADIEDLDTRVIAIENALAAGASGSFTTVDGKTVTVTAGIITSIV